MFSAVNIDISYGGTTMKIKFISKIINTVLILVFLLQPLQSVAAGSSGVRMAGFPLAYQNEGVLVRVPAAIGDVAGGIVGGALGLAIGSPLGILLAPARIKSIVHGQVSGGYIFGMVGRLSGGTITGAPFLVVQRFIREVSNVLGRLEYKYRNHLPG